MEPGDTVASNGRVPKKECGVNNLEEAIDKMGGVQNITEVIESKR